MNIEELFKILLSNSPSKKILNKEELVDELVNDIIKYNYNDENTISYAFDRMLSIEFVYEKD